jgi:hypothetical protein
LVKAWVFILAVLYLVGSNDGMVEKPSVGGGIGPNKGFVAKLEVVLVGLKPEVTDGTVE